MSVSISQTWGRRPAQLGIIRLVCSAHRAVANQTVAPKSVPETYCSCDQLRGRWRQDVAREREGATPVQVHDVRADHVEKLARVRHDQQRLRVLEQKVLRCVRLRLQLCLTFTLE